MGQRLWVIDDAVAIIDNGRVTLQIDKPTRHLPRKEAFHVADKVWFAEQMRQLEVARKRGETKEIQLTDRRRRSSLRMGGGFMITQGTKLVVVRRHLDAPRPGQLCECGGVFEFIQQDFEDDPEDVRNDYVASLLKESQEIVLIQGDVLYIPQLAPSPLQQIGFEPPGTLDAYNRIIEEEMKNEVTKAHIPVDINKARHFWIKMLDYERAVRLEYAYSPALSVEVTAEIDSSSLECVGVLSFPEDIGTSVKVFLEEQLSVAEKKLESESDAAKKKVLRNEIAETKKKLQEAESKDIRNQKVEYWDSELGWDSKKQKEDGPIDRDIYLIDINTGEVEMWKKVKGKRRRRREKTTLWKELSATRLGPGGTKGRLSTEKLERAIRMHGPFTHLQPLITY